MCWEKNKIRHLKGTLVSILYLNLPLHGNAKQCDEVEQKDRPKYRDIEDLKECTEHGNQSCLRD